MSEEKRDTICIVVMVALLALLLAAIDYRFHFKWLNGSIHVAKVNRHHNGTDTIYFLEVPIWPAKE